MNISKKILLTLIILTITLTVIAMAAIFVPAVSEWFSINFGGVGAGIINALQTPFRWGLTGGAQTAALYGIGGALMFGFAYWIWHCDIPYKLQGVTAPDVQQSFSNTVKKEPDEPELAPTVGA